MVPAPEELGKGKVFGVVKFALSGTARYVRVCRFDRPGPI
jgi:hypothetical protein